MEELNSSSHIVRVFRHDYHLSAQKQMIKKAVYKALLWLQTMHVTLTRAGTGIPAGNVMILLHEGVTLTKWHSIQVLLSGVLTWLKWQVCTETLMFLAVRMH